MGSDHLRARGVLWEIEIVNKRVFISCSREDRHPTILGVVSEWLQHNMPEATAEYAENPPGEGTELQGDLRKRIEGSSQVVVVWSKHAAASGWVQYELGLADALDKPISVLLSDDTPI